MPRAATAKKPALAKKVAATTSAPDFPTPDEDEGDTWFVAIDEIEDYTNSLFYGREGSTKTTSAASMVNIRDTGKVLIINAEGGLKKKPLQKRGIDTTRIGSWPKKGERVTYQGLDRIYRRVKADLERDPNSWIGVVIDSATEVYSAILDHVQRKRVDIVKRSGKDVDEDFVDIADYGTMSKMFRDIMRKFRDLPCHVVFTALERRDVDKDTGKPQYGPAVTPGLQADLLGYVDFVLMFKAPDEDGPARALTKANSRYRAKDRFDVLPRVLAEPRFDRIMGYLNDDLTAETDPFQDDLTVAAQTSADKTPASETDDDEDGDDDSDDD